ncbi:MAG: ABC transporter permease, partial [Cyanobacteria bacterium P01_F01_bin.42]
MTSSWITQLGNWNPQLLREFRGRLRPRSLVAAIALSIIFQGLLLLIFFRSNEYLTSDDWFSLWMGLSRAFPYVLFCVGGFYLVNNLAQEEKSGTLNFIRLSPRPAWQILLGKLFGVPILPAIAIGSIFPLHLISAFLGNVPILLCFSYYLMLGVGCLFFWCLAILIGLTASHRSGLAGQATTISIAYAAIAFIALVPLWYSWNTWIAWFPIVQDNPAFDRIASGVEWSWIAINKTFIISHGFTLVNYGIILFLLWRVMLRRFQRPRTTLLSRRQSYGIMAYTLVFVLGFFLNSNFLSTDQDLSRVNNRWDLFYASAMGAMLLLTYVLTLMLMGAICPRRQALMEWSRQSKQGMLGMIWADRSPITVSSAVLLIIANGIIVPFIVIFSYGREDQNILN